MRTKGMKRNRSQKKMLNMQETRMAFYAKLLDKGKLTLNQQDAEEWRRDLPHAIQVQYELIDRGHLPIQLTLKNVRKLKTLDVSNETPRAFCWNS